MAKQKRAAKKRIADAQQKQFDEIATGITADVKILIDENPELKRKVDSAGLLHDEAAEE